MRYVLGYVLAAALWAAAIGVTRYARADEASTLSDPGARSPTGGVVNWARTSECAKRSYPADIKKDFAVYRAIYTCRLMLLAFDEGWHLSGATTPNPYPPVAMWSAEDGR